MNKTYCKLSEHLFNNIDSHSRVDEGLSDFMKKMFGGFGFLVGIFGGENNRKDKIGAAMEAIMKEEADAEKTRMEKELESEENLEIAKMKAQSAAERKRLDAVSQQKRDAYDATTRKIDNLKKKIESGKLLPTAAQTAAIIDEIEQCEKDLTLEEDSPLKQMKDLALKAFVKPDGSVRDPEEAIKLLNKADTDLTPEEKEIKSAITEYNNVAKKHNKDIIDSMNSPAFQQDFMKTVFERAAEEDSLPDKEKKVDDKEKAYKANCDAVTAFKDLKKQHEDAVKAKDDADKKVSEIENSPFVSGDGGPGVDNDGKVKSLETGTFKQAIKKIANDSSKSKTDIEAELTKLGVPSSTIDAITSKKPENGTPDNPDWFDSVEVNDDDWTAASEKVAEKQTENLRSAKEAADSAKSVVEEHPDPDTAAGREKLKSNPDTKSIVENYESIPKEDRESNKYDPTDPNAGKAEKTRIEKLRKDFEDQKKSIEERKAAKAEERATALTRIAGRSENKLPEGIDKKTIEKELDGLEAGEIKKDGKIGIEITDGTTTKFIPKPKPGSDEEDGYIAQREKKVLSTKLNSTDDNVKIKKNPDQNAPADKTYIKITTDENGNTTETECSKEDAEKEIIKQRQTKKDKALILKQKQDLKKAADDCLKNGNLDKKKFDALSDAQKEAINAMLEDPKKIDDYFGGTSEDVKALKDNIEKNSDKYLDAVEAEDLLDDTVDNSADSDYDDDDAAYNSDETEEDKDNAVDKSGKKLKRGEDGKWYREEDFNEDGSLKDGAASQKMLQQKT